MSNLECSRDSSLVSGGSGCCRFRLIRPLFARLGQTLFWIIVLLASVQAAGKPEQAAPSPIFPVSGLEREVDFWKTVFTRYERNDILIHDSREIYLIYEVLAVAGDYEKSAAVLKAQNSAISHAVKRWENLLEDLSEKLRKQQARTQPESELLDKLKLTLGREPSWLEVKGLSGQIHVQRGNREMFTAGWLRSGQYYPHMHEIFRRMEVPTEILALPYFESSFIPVSRSNKGATGVWQFIRSTGKLFLMIDRHFDQRLDPLQATWGSARYLRDAYRRLNSWPLAVMSYNHGTNGICKAKTCFGDDPVRIIRYYSSNLFGFSSRNYYPEFLAALEVISRPETFFPGLKQAEKWQFQEIKLPRAVPAREVMRLGGLSDLEIRRYNPSIRSDTSTAKLVFPAGFILRLPPETSVSFLDRMAGVRGTPAPAADPPTHPAKPAKSSPAPRTETEASTRVHIVAPQETLYRIAKNYGVSVAQLQQWNHLKGLLIQTGQRLVIRGGKKN